MSGNFVNNASSLATALYSFCTQPTVGLYPVGFKGGRVLFGPNVNALAVRAPLVAADGSPRSVFFAEEPHTLRGMIDDTSLISRERSNRGLFREIHRIEGLLNNSPADIFKAAGQKALGLEQFRPGFSERIARYSETCLRDIIRGKRPQSSSGAEDAAELAVDIESAAALREGSLFDSGEILLMAGALFASLGDLYRQGAIKAFSGAFENFIAGGRDNAALIAADLAVQSAGGFQPDVGEMSLGAMMARAARNAAQGYANTDPIGTMIARHRGISAAIATGSWSDAGVLFRLDADASTGLDRAHGLVRSAWAFARWEMAEKAGERWPQINWLLNTAGTMMEGLSDGVDVIRGLGKTVGELAKD
ncbi:MAG: hypothetical protein JXA24_06020 [Proteobacteria bacterium]|nr:hypothetical protein [Pseudomonadota bacterium]